MNNTSLTHKMLITFLIAGDPSAECTAEYILEMERAGADLVEIGIPFSDPTGEEAVIQEANGRALKEGMTTQGIFQIVEKIRKQSQIPLALITYLNPVFHYGYDRFFQQCEKMGVDFGPSFCGTGRGKNTGRQISCGSDFHGGGIFQR